MKTTMNLAKRGADDARPRDVIFRPMKPATDRGWDAFSRMADALDAARKRQVQHQHLVTVGTARAAIFCNLAHHYLSGSSATGVAVSRRKHKTRATRYEPYSYPAVFPKVLDEMCALGFLTQQKGVYSSDKKLARRTTIVADSKLVNLIDELALTLADIDAGGSAETIVLKSSKATYWDESALIDYEETSLTTRLRNELNAINDWLASAEVGFVPPSDFVGEVDCTKRRMVRNFTRGSFQSGGRLFGAFWENLERAARRAGLRIDGQSIVELDFEALQPKLAYKLAGAVPVEGDPYALAGFATDEATRDGIKRAFSTLYFRDPTNTRWPKGLLKVFPKGMKFAQVRDAIFERHPALKSVLATPDIGHSLQYLESELMMKILKACLEKKITALPIHDSVVVKPSNAAMVEGIMAREFQEFAGFSIRVRVK